MMSAEENKGKTQEGKVSIQIKGTGLKLWDSHEPTSSGVNSKAGPSGLAQSHRYTQNSKETEDSPELYVMSKIKLREISTSGKTELDVLYLSLFLPLSTSKRPQILNIKRTQGFER